MLVKDYMTRHPIMIEPKKPVLDAQKLMVENGVRHIPVVGSGKRLLGLITQERLNIPPEQLGSLNVWEITRLLSNLTVERVMARGVDLLTIGENDTLEHAAALLAQKKDSGLVVTDKGGIVVGIITETDLLIELQNLLGANSQGWRVTMRVPDKRGEFMRLTNAIMEKGWTIMALGSVKTPKSDAQWDVLVKVRGCEKEDLENMLATLEGQKLVDLRVAL